LYGQEYTTVWGVDPGSTDMFMAVDGCSVTSHRIRKTSTKEYYDLCGYNHATEKRNQWKKEESTNVHQIIDATPTLKTSNLEQTRIAISYRLENFFRIVAYYDRDLRFKVLKLRSYKGRQKGLAEIGRRLTHGSRKYGNSPEPFHTHMLQPQDTKRSKWKNLPNCDRPADGGFHHHVIAFGNAKFGNIRSKMPAPSKQLLRHLRSLRKLRNCKVSVVMIDEYLTSQVCAHCQRRTLKHARERTSAGSQNGNKIHTVLKCTSCSTVWNRDVMAARNIRSIFMSMAMNNDERPIRFRRPVNTTTPTINAEEPPRGEATSLP
jgi:hypothetical protein